MEARPDPAMTAQQQSLKDRADANTVCDSSQRPPISGTDVV